MTFITNKSTISSNNASTSNLSGDAVYTGTGEAVTPYETITVIIKSSHNSAAAGISIQFGQSTSNWDVKVTDTYKSDGNYTKTYNILAPYFRIVYTNGSTSQTSFRLQCVLNTSCPTNKTIQFADAQYDSFSRIRVSNPYTILD